MTRARLMLLVLVFFAATGGATYEAIVIFRQREQLQAAREHVTRSKEEIASRSEDLDALRSELHLAEQQLAKLPPPPAATVDSAATRARQREIADWLERVKQLKRHFEQRPEQRIPEMQLLTDDDWLRAASTAGLETDGQIRKVVAAVRDAAKRKFNPKLAGALKKFMQATNGQLPRTALDLANFFEPPVDLAILQRYEMIPAGQTGGSKAYWVIREISPVDEDFDSRFQVAVNGALMWGAGPTAWTNGFSESHQRARRKYAEANGGVAPATLAETLPYFNPPLDPALVEKLLKAEQARAAGP